MGAILRSRLTAGLARLRVNAEAIVQTSVAAAISWVIADTALGHTRAFFAPIAAMIALGVAGGRRSSRALQLILGIGSGIVIGGVIVAVAGTGPVQVAVACLIGLAVAVVVEPSPLFASQTAVSAVLVVTLEPASPGSAPGRLADAVIGGAVGLAVLAIVSRDPVRPLQAAGDAALGSLAATLDAIGDALSERDAAMARAARADAVGLDPEIRDLADLVTRAAEASRLRSVGRTAKTIERYRRAVGALPAIVQDVAALARAAARAIEVEHDVPEPFVPAAHDLADAVRDLGRFLRAGTGPEPGRTASERAVSRLAETGERTPMAVGAMAGELRATAADILRAFGVGDADAVSRVRSAAGRRSAAAAASSGTTSASP